ncbi:hypothetical protein JCGZ_21355 [Jatropha curcas]|uniref:F-box domain-containing protein n=1 Tax=Jatropha curcas TaxID=180498 RepID=A0A067JMY6_JATCU|nr:F-box protein At1g61340 [Jatropha curcas]XP_012091492.1 F-box protein At1g61340 [Jatropha curcas]XP_020541211.1 F-box protein At1g61340 [Jatropha curcas]KDP20884.1 hypothetical protein JCGZ_21355 [Jatropha curcas]
MALGRRCNSMKSRRTGIFGEEGLGFGFVKYTRSFGRKRILISNSEDFLPLDSPIQTPLKRHCNLEPEKSALESLPQDILVKILCGVDHDDLKQLFHVSTVIREATLVAKKWHFAYSTPKKTPAFRTSIDFENPSEFEDIEAPNAPKVPRSYKSRLNGKNLADISVALFASPRKELFLETET